MTGEQFLSWCKTHTFADGSFQKEPLVMGILNVTPDSFYDGGRYFDASQAYERAAVMIDQGVDVIDIGGESTRPGATPVSSAEELDRVIPIIERIRGHHDICISIDTSKSEVMQAAVAVGASFINDIKALRQDNALSVAASLRVPVCLMHMQGEPQTMQRSPYYYGDVIDEVNQFFDERVAACLAAGMLREHLLLDPGFGFGKTVTHNLHLVRRLGEFQRHNLPLLLGVSRKSTIGTILNQPAASCLSGGLALAIFAMLQGVSIIRTHDVLETKQAFCMINHVMISERKDG